MGLLKTVPSRIDRMVPFGDGHAFLSLYSTMRSASGVMVAHFTPTPCSLMAFAASLVTAVVRLVPHGETQVEVLQVYVEKRHNEPLFDHRPDDAGHLVAVHLDEGVLYVNLGHIRPPTYVLPQCSFPKSERDQVV